VAVALLGSNSTTLDSQNAAVLFANLQTPVEKKRKNKSNEKEEKMKNGTINLSSLLRICGVRFTPSESGKKGKTRFAKEIEMGGLRSAIITESNGQIYVSGVFAVAARLFVDTIII